MRKRHIMIILVAVLFGLNGWAQLDIGMQNSQPVVPSWENYELMQYGKIGASMYTGTVNYSIPIYTYKDKDFEIPISIDYATNGLRVNHSSGILGHGWSLYTPGVITRQVRGIPDERDDMVLCRLLAYYPTVMYHGYKQLVPGYEYSGEMLISNTGKPYVAKYQTFYNNNNYYETNPDLYTFNFCGFSGSFSRNLNNEIINGSVFKVFETEGKSRGLIVSQANQSAIEIVDMNGYVYHFMFDDMQDLHDDDEGINSFRVTTSWILTSITAPNGRSANFTYEHTFLNKDIISNSSSSYSYVPRSNHYYMECPNLYIGTSSSAYVIDEVPSNIRRLQRITFDGDETSIEFSYQAGESESYNGSGQTFTAVCDEARLTEVRVLHGANIVKSCHFSYGTSSLGNTVSFLKQVDISGEGTYTFDYNQEGGSYPLLGTSAYDHWGYYNGNGFPLNNPKHYINEDMTTFDETIQGNVKAPSFTCANMGTLCRINYPTGGFSTLEYEPHTYSRAVARNSTTLFEPELVAYGTNKTAGGVRVSRIVTQVSPQEPVDTIWYIYNREDSATLSSGILVNTPRYGVKYSCYGSKQVEFYDLSNQIYDYNRTHIEYTNVTMSTNSNGHMVNHFTCSATDSCQDIIDNNYSHVGMNLALGLDVPTAGTNTLNTLAWSVYQAEPPVQNILTPVPSLQFRRGHLLSTEEYSSSNQIVRKTVNRYRYPTAGYDTIYQIAGEITACVLNPMHSLELTSTTTTEYNGTDSLSKTEQYEYNRIGLPTVVKTSTSLGDTVVTRNTYVVDTVASTPTLNDQTIIDMADKHLLGKLLSSQTHRVSGTAEKLLSAARLTYYKPDPNKTKLFCPSTKQEWVSGDNWKTVEQYQFDAMGNLVEIVDESALANSYLWSYGSRHMVSTLQNATKSQTETALASVGLHSVDSLARMTNLTSADFGKVKNLGQQLLSSLQDAWRYRPLVGMTESAPPNHAGATYHYDGYGRLTEIRDDMGKVVGQQEYNIVSVLPMTSTMHRDSLRLNEGVVAASVTAQGGSGSYSYQWQLADSTGAVLQTGTGSQMSQNLLPGNYTITFTVADMVSGESATHTWLAAVPVRFSNISDPVTVNGWTTVTAGITLGAASNVGFSVDYAAPYSPDISNTFKVTIGNQTYNYSGTGLSGIQKSLSAGTTTVSISMYNADQGEAILSLTSVGNLSIGVPCTLSFGGLSKNKNQQ